MSVAHRIIDHMTPKLADNRPDYLRILAFEAANTGHGPEKNLRIRRELGITEVRYYVLLGRAAESADGIKADPLTARMVRQRAAFRATRRDQRSLVSGVFAE